MRHRLRLASFLKISIVFLSLSYIGIAQEARPYVHEAEQIIHDGLSRQGTFQLLSEMVASGPRLSGSLQSEKAIQWAIKKMRALGFDSVWHEPVMVPHWVRGPVERAEAILPKKKKIPLTVCALGGSIGTPKRGLEAEVLEVQSLEEAIALRDRAKGKILFFNRPMDPSKIYPFDAYGGVVDQRSRGAIVGAQVGAIGVLVRSMTLTLDDVPHTGSMNYADTIPKIPAAALSTAAANRLSQLLKESPTVRVHMQLSCDTLPDVESSNVIGEIRGTEKPEEIVLLGGHFDSWDKGTGAHDDGAGCAQSIEAAMIMKRLNLALKRTIRVVLFTNEENGLRGGLAYAQKHQSEKHIAAFESDAGGFSPRAFGVGTDSLTYKRITSWSYLMEPLGIDHIRFGGGGGDIGSLRNACKALIGLGVDPQRYFDYHHSDHDRIEGVHPRELELGTISIAILAYVIAQEGL